MFISCWQQIQSPQFFIVLFHNDIFVLFGDDLYYYSTYIIASYIEWNW